MIDDEDMLRLECKAQEMGVLIRAFQTCIMTDPEHTMDNIHSFANLLESVFDGLARTIRILGGGEPPRTETEAS